MLHQNKRGMQKAARCGWLRDRNQFAGRIEQLYEERGLGTRDWGLWALDDVPWAQVAAV